jgi:D-3-phosphoglycerate dehydrogenase
LAEEAVHVLKQHYHVDVKELRGDDLAQEIGAYDALIIRSATKATADIIARGDNLKVIGRAGIGVENIDVDAASKKGIYIVNSPTGSTQSVAELVFAHMLGLARHISQADATMKDGVWAKKQLKGIELFEKTVGIVGCGNIGKMVAQIANAFQMTIIGYDPFLSKEQMESAGIKKIDKLTDLFQNADFITLHLPHTPKTHYLIDYDVLAHMKPSAYLINCARGGIVNENDLHRILKENKIAGAALDVFEQEPVQSSPLFEFKQATFTPHLGASTKEGQIRAGVICAEQVIKVLEGNEPDHWVNRAKMKS